jgi:hypothetical protein
VTPTTRLTCPPVQNSLPAPTSGSIRCRVRYRTGTILLRGISPNAGNRLHVAGLLVVYVGALAVGAAAG